MNYFCCGITVVGQWCAQWQLCRPSSYSLWQSDLLWCSGYSTGAGQFSEYWALALGYHFCQQIWGGYVIGSVCVFVCLSAGWLQY